MADLEDKKVSQLESGTVTSNSVFLDSGNGVSTKVGSQDVANFVGKTHAFSGSGGLNTTAKTLVGAINEVAGSAGKSNLADMDDVNIDDQTLAGGQAIVYDDTNDEWVNGDVASALESLTDVDIDSTSLADGQAIVYDETNDKWVNGDVASGASANEALPYDENTSYVYGNYCTNLGYLWRCTSTTGTTGTWDATKWVAVMITDEYKRVRIMTKAQFDLLSADEKDGFIYVSDYPTKIQDIDNVTLTTSDNNKLLGVSVSGSDISVGAVEVTADDIPYSTGVSVADKLDSLTTVKDVSSSVTKYTNIDYFEKSVVRSGNVVCVYISFSFSSTPTANNIIAENLPKAAANMLLLCECTSGSNNGKASRVMVNTNGRVLDWYTSGFFGTGMNYSIIGSYITNVPI